jgi:hypothetical protein
MEITGGGNRAGRVGFGFGSDWVGSIYMMYFFRSLIYFDWIEGHLISGRVGLGRVGSI